MWDHHQKKKITCFNCVCRNSHKMLYFQTICIYLRRRKCKKKNIINKSHTFFCILNWIYYLESTRAEQQYICTDILIIWIINETEVFVCIKFEYISLMFIQLMINKFIVKIIGCQQYRLKQFLTMFYSLVNVTDWCLSPLKSSCSFNVLWKLILYWTFIWNLNYITSVCYVNILGFIISTT